MDDDLLAAIQQANTSAVAAACFDHPQYIDGSLYVTPEQLNVLTKWAAEQPLDPTNTRSPVTTDISVVVLKVGQTVTGTTGKSLIYLNDGLRTFDANELELWRLHQANGAP